MTWAGVEEVMMQRLQVTMQRLHCLSTHPHHHSFTTAAPHRTLIETDLRDLAARRAHAAQLVCACT
jgi:hypothetical protein